MDVDLRPVKKLRESAAARSALGPIIEAVCASPADLARLRVVCDWIQYRGNFREPVVARPIARPDSGTDSEDVEIAVDLRRCADISPEGLAAEVKSALEHLLDRLVESEAREVKTELEARADYREYFRYDLKILHADGGFSLYDRVSGDKSGGETQTPYYIAILASMYRMYRSRAIGEGPVCGVVLLDEAFGKMDEARIGATLTYARRLGLQLVLATPKERSELVAPYVERTLLIHKEPMSGIPEVFDFTKEFAADAAVSATGADGDPDALAGRVRT